MVHVILGAKGSGNTRSLVEAINKVIEREKGSMVCLEKGDDLRFDVDHRVRLLNVAEYGIDNYNCLRGFLSGLYGGNYDISHIFIDNLYKVAGSDDTNEAEEFMEWCEKFSEQYDVEFTIAVCDEPKNVPYGIRKHA